MKKETTIKNIPTVITQDHHHVYNYWQNLRNAVLFHIDAHPDMLDRALVPKEEIREEFDCNKHFTVANFICPAVHEKILSSIYWLNPHSQKQRLQDLGTTNKMPGRRHLKTIIRSDEDYYSKYHWDSTKLDHSVNYESITKIINGDGKVITTKEVKVNNSPLILDIDLDAFCCDKSIYNVPVEYFGIENFEERIDQTAEVLSSLIKPDLITITRSVGQGGVYVPLNKVDDVQYLLIERLREIY